MSSPGPHTPRRPGRWGAGDVLPVPDPPGRDGGEDSAPRSARSAGSRGASAFGPKVATRIGKENDELQSTGVQPSPGEAAFGTSFSKQQDETLTPF